MSPTIRALILSAAVVCAGGLTAGAQASAADVTPRACAPLVDGVRTYEVATFAAAEQRLATDCPAEREINVVFAPGVHYEAGTLWDSYHRPGQTLRFMTKGYTGYDRDGTDDGACMPQANMATFNGSYHDGTLVGFNFGGNQVRDLNLEFYCMKFSRVVREFVSVKPKVAESDYGTYFRGLKFHGMVFYLLGNTELTSGQMTSESYGRGAIVTGNVGGLIVKDSVFSSLVNKPTGFGPGPGHVHALYLRRGTDGALITNNTMQSISGDPFRVSHHSDDNILQYNTITNSGEYALGSDWYNTSGANNHGPSYGNVVRYNRFDHKYGTTAGPAKPYCYDIRGTCPANRMDSYGNSPL